MDKSSVAERILICVCTKPRASEIIGDLLEQGNSPSSLKFWCSVLGIVFAMSWRWSLGVLAAFWAFAPALRVFIVFVALHAGPHPRNVPWAVHAFVLVIVSVFISASAILGAVRFGLRNFSSRVALLLAALCAIAACFTRLPGALYTIPFALASALVALFFHSSTRRPLLSILCTAGAQAGIYFLSFNAVSYAHRPSAYVAIGAWSLSVGSAAWVFSQLQRRMVDQSRPVQSS